MGAHGWERQKASTGGVTRSSIEPNPVQAGTEGSSLAPSSGESANHRSRWRFYGVDVGVPRGFWRRTRTEGSRLRMERCRGRRYGEVGRVVSEKRYSSYGGPRVRILLPPAESLEQTGSTLFPPPQCFDATDTQKRHCRLYQRYGAPWLANLCAKRSRATVAYAAAVPAGGSNGPLPQSRPR